MARLKFLPPMLVLLMLMASCAPSPLYVPPPRIGTVGEIPRDGRGEPIWSAIKPPPPEEPMRPMPVYGAPPAPSPAAPAP